jgi:endonuclease/exonuclease/phosphatase family metal-dependent hydrolase
MRNTSPSPATTQTHAAPRLARSLPARASGFVRGARLAVALAGAVCAALPGFAEPVRVLTFNILSSYLGADKAGEKETARIKRWEKREPLVIEVMRDHPDGSGPYDFIGTQETSVDTRRPESDQTLRLPQAMPGYGSLYEPCTGRPALRRYSLSNMILWRKDRWELDARDHGTFWLSSTPDVPGSTDWLKEGQPASKRCVTYGLFHETGPKGRTGRRVYFYNTHLYVRAPAACEKSAVLIMERIAGRRDKTAPVLLTGDMNSRQWSATMRYFLGETVTLDGRRRTAPLALRDTYDAIHPGQAALAPGARPRPPLFADKIDHILASADFTTTSAKRIETHREDLWPSDHYPYESVLEFGAEKQ